MKIFDFLITDKIDVDATNKLYFRLSDNATTVDNYINLPNNEFVLLDTYYNLISSKYFHYANIVKPYINIEYCGNIVVELHCRSMFSDDIVCTTNLVSTKNSTGQIFIDNTIKEKSFLYLKITSKQDNSKFFGGSFNTDTEPKDIKLGAVICTYHREDFVKNNLAKIEEYFALHEDLASKIEIFVVDNGKTLTKNDLPSFVNIIPNENTGGSGGFTRGLREIIKLGGFTHFLFMDDDISIEPSVLYRTVSLLSILKDKYKDASIGGTMLIKDKPTFQHEFGAYWTGSKFMPIETNLDLASRYSLLVDENYFDAQYNAWWYCCMPTSVVDKIGYPLEMLFVQFDDVEYGLRNNGEFININGIGVWHENFSNKYNPSYEYFVKRNNMIVISRYSKKGFFTCFFKYLVAVAKALMQQRYYIIDIVNVAYNDFLQGADYVKTISGPEKLKELAKFCPKQVDKQEIEDKFGINLDDELAKTITREEHRFIETLTLNSYLLPKCTYDGIRVVDMVKPLPIDFYKTKQVVHYNNYTGKAFVTTIDKKMLFKGLHNINKMFFKLMFKYKKASKTYKNIDCTK